MNKQLPVNILVSVERSNNELNLGNRFAVIFLAGKVPFTAGVSPKLKGPSLKN